MFTNLLGLSALIFLVWTCYVLFQLFSTINSHTSTCAKVSANKSTSRVRRWVAQKQTLIKSVKWKHNFSRAALPHHITGRKLKPGLPWVVRKTSTPSGKTNIHVCSALSLRDWMFTNSLWRTGLNRSSIRINSLFQIYSLLECHFPIVCKILPDSRHINPNTTLLVFLIYEIKAE